MRHEKGQSLIEVIVSATVGILVVTALTFATIFSLRNAQFAKTSAQATKLAQEGIEKLRASRNHADPIGGSFVIAEGVPVITSWQDPNLWAYRISSACPSKCYFKFGSSGFTYYGTGVGSSFDMPSGAEDVLGDGKFQRAVILSDDSLYATQKIATVIVRWSDFSGNHDSKLITILGKL